MESAELKIVLTKTPKGNIRISKGGCSVLIVNSMENIPLISFLEVELTHALKNKTNETTA